MLVPRLSPIAEEVRNFDRDRYVTALLAPADRRDSLLGLYAFNLEIARVRESVREPALGRMRLQWWREAIDTAYRGAAASHPAAQALRDLVHTHEPSRSLFDRLVDAREADLEELPPADLPALEAYAEGTAATLVALSIEILGLDDDVSFAVGRHVGIAWGLTGILRAVPFHASIGRLLLPSRLMADHDVRPADVLAGRASPGLAGVGRRVAALAREHLALARTHAARVPRAALPGLLTAPLAEIYLDLLEAAGGNLMDTNWSQPRPRPALLAWKMWRGRY